MRCFSMMQLRDAYAYSLSGGQALHTHNIVVYKKRPPRCFLNAIRKGEQIGHLFDQDSERLIKTARSLGVNVIVIEDEGTKRQHIDLCAGPLRRAIELCKENNG